MVFQRRSHPPQFDNGFCHREGAPRPLRGDRGDLSRLRNALSVERAASISKQIAAPLRGSQ
ncbi:MAG: hypothetical protein ACYDGL_12595 [Bellilinea sp.]